MISWHFKHYNTSKYFLLDFLYYVRVAHSCPTLCNPMDYTDHGILQARILEWVAFPFSGDLPDPGIEPRSPALQVDSLPAEPQGKPFLYYKRKKVKSLSLVWLFATPWTVAYQASLSMGFSRQVYWSRLPFPSPRFLYYGCF